VDPLVPGRRNRILAVPAGVPTVQTVSRRLKSMMNWECSTDRLAILPCETARGVLYSSVALDMSGRCVFNNRGKNYNDERAE